VTLLARSPISSLHLLNSIILESLLVMKRRLAAFLTRAGLGWIFAASPTVAADYGTASPNTSQGYRLIQGNVAGSLAATNAFSAQPGASEFRAQLILLTALAQDHRERADAATRNGQAALAKWESDLALELGQRGSNLVAQVEGPDTLKQALLGAGAVGATSDLSSAELDYLAKLQERNQTLQQELVSATELTRQYALQLATNRSNTVVYGDVQTAENNVSLRLQEIGREIQRVQEEQAELELKKTHFWALRAMVRSALSPRSIDTNQVVPNPSK
jgi:hypothetical protein